MSSKHPLRVLHLPLNIRWIMDATIKGQHEIGVETERMLISSIGVDDNDEVKFYFRPQRDLQNRMKGYPAYVKDLSRYFGHYFKLLIWCDVVHWQYSMRLWEKDDPLKNLDFLLIRLLRKPAIAQFHGGDFRDSELVMKTNPWWHEAYEPEFMAKLINIARVTQRDFAKAGFVLALRVALLPFVRPENVSQVIVLERVRDISSFVPHLMKPKEDITIVHAPSNPPVKGTRHIVAVISALQEKYPINFILVQDKSSEEVIEAMSRADIVIDDVISGDYNLAAVEAMALGKPVLAYLDEDNSTAYPEGMPVINASPLTLSAVLEDLINSPERRAFAAAAGPAYAQRMHSIESVTPEVLKAYRFAAKRKNNKKVIRRIDEALRVCQERGWKGISDE